MPSPLLARDVDFSSTWWAHSEYDSQNGLCYKKHSNNGVVLDNEPGGIQQPQLDIEDSADNSYWGKLVLCPTGYEYDFTEFVTSSEDPCEDTNLPQSCNMYHNFSHPHVYCIEKNITACGFCFGGTSNVYGGWTSTSTGVVRRTRSSRSNSSMTYQGSYMETCSVVSNGYEYACDAGYFKSGSQTDSSIDCRPCPENSSTTVGWSMAYCVCNDGYKTTASGAMSNRTSSEPCISENTTSYDYTVTLNKGGGTGGQSALYIVDNNAMYLDPDLEHEIFYNCSFGALDLPERNGYTFNGYYSQASGGEQYVDNYGCISADAYSYIVDIKHANDTWYAQWTASQSGSDCHAVTLLKSNSTNYSSDFPTSLLPKVIYFEDSADEYFYSDAGCRNRLSYSSIVPTAQGYEFMRWQYQGSNNNVISNNNGYAYLSDPEYNLYSTDIWVLEPYWTCASGYSMQKDASNRDTGVCGTAITYCNAGQFKGTDGTCHFCPQGTYQPQSNFTGPECIKCPPHDSKIGGGTSYGTTSGEGATSISNCFVPSDGTAYEDEFGVYEFTQSCGYGA